MCSSTIKLGLAFLFHNLIQLYKLDVCLVSGTLWSDMRIRSDLWPCTKIKNKMAVNLARRPRAKIKIVIYSAPSTE